MIYIKIGKKQEQLSSIVDTQKNINESILGMDYETFISIIYYNPSISESIFNVPKTQKRSFLEKIFGLEVYSEISKKINEKLSFLNNKITEANRNIEFNKNSIETTNNQIGSLNESCSEDSIIDLLNDINKLEDKKDLLNKNIKDIQNENYEVKKILIEEKILNFSNKNIELDKELYNLNSKLKELNIIEINFNIENYEKMKDEINHSENYDFNIETLEKDIDKINESNEQLKEEKIEIDKELIKLSLKIENNNKLSSGICPICENDKISIVDIKNTEIHLLKVKENNNKKLNNISEKLLENGNEIKQINRNISEQKKLKQNLLDLKEYFYKLEEKKKEYDLFKENELSYKNIKIKIKELNKEQENNNIELNKLNKLKDVLSKELLKLNSLDNDIENIKKDIENKKYLLNELKIKIESINKVIFENKELLIKYDNLIIEENKNIKKYQNFLDYFNFIKNICKDENIKQYAISNIVPFLSQKANGYLSDAGFDFYLKLDSWLNVEIKGSGIRDAGFGNLSSGQQKTTNLAMMLAFLDISKLQSAIFPNILLLDEVLDGAIDSITLTQMLDILGKKQKEDKLKMFIVSHRKELNELCDVSNFYKVEMQNRI